MQFGGLVETHQIEGVSILTRPEGRMQLFVIAHSQVHVQQFQSSPGQKAGCNLSGWGHQTSSLRFNPHPARRPDAMGSSVGSIPFASRFNPHPARRPDAIRVGQMPIGIWEFQSSPGQKAGCNG